jgi:SulP family sulfate permease
MPSVPREREPGARRHPIGRWIRFIRWRIGRYFKGVRIDFFPAAKVVKRVNRKDLPSDMRAGVNVALLAFPQSIAYSLIAGLPAQYGLISSGVGAVTGPLFSGSRFIVLGPTNATAILIFSGFASVGLGGGEIITALPLFILLVGFFQILGAIARLSVLINYISRTVITGYVTAAAALIMMNQVQNALGFKIEGESTFFGILAETFHRLPETRWPELAMATTALVCNLGLRRFAPRLPDVALTIVLTGLLAVGFEHMGWHLNYLSGFSLGEIRLLAVVPDLNLIGELSVPAMALAFVAILEGASVGKTVASQSGGRLDVNQEMYGMGMANVTSSLVGGMDTSGSLTRSALSAASGARTPIATIIAGIIILILLFSVGFLIGFIPKAALAAVVMCIAVTLLNKHHILAALRTTWSDSMAFFVTFGAAMLFTLDAAIYLGALTSVVLFLHKAGVPELVEYDFNPEGQLAEKKDSEARAVPGIAILHAEGDLFFGSTEIFAEQTRQVTRDPNLKIIILRLKNAHHLDSTAVLAIEELLHFLRQNDRDLIVSGADREIRRVFRNSGVLEDLGSENFFAEVASNPTLSTRNALKRAQEILGRKDAKIRIFVDAAKKAKKDAEG